MRLINAQSLRLEEHFDSNAPPYAILSHTWEDGEVSFQDTALPASAKTRSKPGYKKIEETCRLACEHGLELSWVDTCCIDKSSSAELTESINSMFRWYQDASICFVYLSDLEPTVSIQDGMKRCRWFRRGWTLQELLAPRNIQFYDRDWKFRGTKDNFVDIIKATTRIPKSILQGQTSIRDYSVASKMAWAAKRKTTRIEDTAYCLMGIFGVNMALIYGEGPRAFKRLQEEIVKNSNDLTIFSWDEADRTLAHQNLFATSPAAFAGRGGTKPYDRSELNPEFAITNKGLRIESRLQTMVCRDPSLDIAITKYRLTLGAHWISSDNCVEIGIILTKIGPGLFVRDGRAALSSIPHGEAKQMPRTPVHSFFILLDRFDADNFKWYRPRSFVFLPNEPFFRVVTVMPESHWDATRCLFFPPTTISHVFAVQFEVDLEGSPVQFVVLVDYTRGKPVLRAFEAAAAQYLHLQTWLFRPKNLAESLLWDDMTLDVREMLGDSRSECTVLRGSTEFRVVFSARNETTIGGNVAFSVHLDVEKSTGADLAPNNYQRLVRSPNRNFASTAHIPILGPRD